MWFGSKATISYTGILLISTHLSSDLEINLPLWFWNGMNSESDSLMSKKESSNLATNSASVRLDSGVKPHVPRQHVGSREGSIAEVTHVRQTASSVGRPRLVPWGHVLCKPVRDGKNLTADGADEDDVACRQWRRAGRFGYVWRQLEAV